MTEVIILATIDTIVSIVSSFFDHLNVRTSYPYFIVLISHFPPSIMYLQAIAVAEYIERRFDVWKKYKSLTI